MKWFLLKIYRHITINNTERMNIYSNWQHVFYSLHRLLLLTEQRQCMSDYIDCKKQHTLNILLNSSCIAYLKLRPPNSEIFVTALFWHESAQSVQTNLPVNPLTDTALFWNRPNLQSSWRLRPHNRDKNYAVADMSGFVWTWLKII